MAARTLIVLLLLIIALRIIGKRQAGELRTIDILVILITANAVQNALTKSDGHVTVSLVCAGTLIVAGWAGGVLLQRKPWFEKPLAGSPIILVRDGEVFSKNLRKEGLTTQDLMVAARKRGMPDIAGAKLAVLEMDGSISVVPERD